MNPITVSDLIEFLKKQQQDIPVACLLYSEGVLLSLDKIKVVQACMPREDGWVPNERPDSQTQTYLMFPGN